MWIIPLIVISAIAFAAASKSSREVEAVQPSRQLPPPGPPEPTRPPGPISMLGEILRVGQVPPPRVILCALAEAEALGRTDLVSDIVRVFVAPVVYQQQSSGGPTYERGSCALPLAPRARADYQRGSCALPRPPLAATVTAPPATEVVPQETLREASEEEILAMLHADPKAFLAMVSSRRPPMVPVEPSPQGPAPSSMQAPPPPIDVAPVAAPGGLPAEIVAQMQDEAAPAPFAPGSPLGGISDVAWCEFVTRLDRESPTFDSSRHVGRYRQRRERLAELGIDPVAIHGSAVAQRAALDTDLADAHAHAAAGGLFEYLGRPIAVPGLEGSEKITLSGVLGVIQCAGLEGAVGWLERPSDRKRYPHTTQAFLRSNGVF